MKLTGIVLTTALPPGETSEYGTLVAPQTLAAHHQHFLSMRLDMAVDGLSNTVYEVDTEAVPPGPGNRLGQRLPACQTAATPRIRGAACDRPIARPVLAGG